MEELSRLEKIAQNSQYAKGVNPYTIAYSFEIFKRYIKGENILEMGPAEGIMTEQLVKLPQKITVVDGAPHFCEQLRLRFPNIAVEQSLFEDYTPSKKFDNIILGHVLEHVEDPVAILKRVAGFLTDDGVILSAVPNALSIHRQAAVVMGLLDTVYAQSEQDRLNGHRRVYDFSSFESDIKAAGLKIKKSGGYWLKPVSNGQIESTWTPEMIWAFMQLGEEYPEIAGELYVVATK